MESPKLLLHLNIIQGVRKYDWLEEIQNDESNHTVRVIL